jgi:hypothetical protein
LSKTFRILKTYEGIKPNYKEIVTDSLAMAHEDKKRSYDKVEDLLEYDDLLELVGMIEEEVTTLYENYFHVKFNL